MTKEEIELKILELKAIKVLYELQVEMSILDMLKKTEELARKELLQLNIFGFPLTNNSQ